MANVDKMTIEKEFQKLAIKEDTDDSITRTGVVYDDDMAHYFCKWDLDYPECPERYIQSIQKCKKYGLIQRCKRIPSRLAAEEEILSLHNKDYYNEVKRTSETTDLDALENLSSKYDSIYFHENSFKTALLSAGSCINLVSAILNNQVQNGMAIIRPPGHHAMKSEACGYCYFNNVAIAAQHAILNHNMERILIIDWDVHHGQGTQFMFYDDPRVLYFSIHRYENGTFWPELRESDYDYVGEGKGKGFNINVPLNKTGMKNGDYWAIFTNVLLPVAYEYSPDLVLISAGYDAAIGCPEGEMEVTPHAYAHLLNSLMGLAGGHICVVLEGGYNLSSLSEGVAMTLRTLLGDPCPLIGNMDPPCDSIVETILNVISVHRPFWRSLCLQGSFSITEDPQTSEVSSKRHTPVIEYHGNLKKPETYPTRSFYPQREAEESSRLDQKIQSLMVNTHLSVPTHRTSLAFDNRMTLHRNSEDKTHLEKPSRIVKIYDKLKNDGLIDRCLLLKSRSATEDEINLIHDIAYINEIKSVEKLKPKGLLSLQEKFRSIYLNKATYQSALLAVGCALETVDSVVSGMCQNGVAVVRPPGHHAESSEACGYCIFNNVAIAAKYALERHHLKKILIIDWDIHHGNGTQHAFYEDPRVLYLSIHRHDHESFFPFLKDASYEAVGINDGIGFNINIPWNNGGKGDGDYLSAFFQIVLPVAYEFNPELVLISAGFDAADGDPLGCCHVTPECFGHMTKLLSGLAYGKVVLILEGGYNLSSIAQAMAQCTSSLLGDPCPVLHTGLKPSTCALSSIQNVMKMQEKYWNCLKFNVELPTSEDTEIQHSLLTTELSAESLEILHRSLESTELPSYPSTSKGSENIPADGTGDNVEKFSNLLLAYCVVPLEWCQHIEDMQPLPTEGLNPFAQCKECGDSSENWVCLHCYEVYCGRYVNKHMLQHGSEKLHPLTLSYVDLSVWCYECDSYVHCEELLPAKQEAHSKKFGSSYLGL